ncbi:MAG: ankyrin repeat domain-containing protein [Deltaproteobacteria bacterium]
MSQEQGDETRIKNLKREAKRWLRRVRNGDRDASERLLAAHPECPPEPTLRDVQHALARERGFEGWRQLEQAQPKGEASAVFSLTARGSLDELRDLLEREHHRAESVWDAARPLWLGTRSILRGQTPLFALPADEELALELLTLLLIHGGQAAAVDSEGRTARDRARERSSPRVAAELLRVVEAAPFRLAWFAAVEKGDVEAAARLLERDPSLLDARRYRSEVPEGESRGSFGVTALHMAAQRGHEPLVSFLLDTGANLELRSSGHGDSGGTPLHWAAQYGHLGVVQQLVERGADLNPEEEVGEDGGVGSHLDFLEHEEIARYLVERGTHADLFSAVRLGLVERARALLDRDSTLLSSRRFVDWTPLHLAARKNQPALVDLLVERGADLQARDRHDRTPVELALFAGCRESYAALLKLGAQARPEAVAKAGGSIDRAVLLARFFGACFRDIAEVRAMLEKEPELARTRLAHFWPDNPVHGTALHVAASQGNGPLIELLLAHGADVTCRDLRYQGHPASWAREFGHPKLSEQLDALRRAEEEASH